MHFLVKVILINFQLDKYMQCKKKNVYIFFLQYLRHSDVTKWGTIFSLASKSLYVVELFTHVLYSYFYVCCIEMVKKESRETLK